MNVRRLVLAAALLSLPATAQADDPPAPPPTDPAVTALWRNPDLPTADRVKALLSQLTMKEKISLLYWIAPAIDRLGIPAYSLGNEGLHGLVRPGSFTVFPQAIGLGATFDPDLVHAMATAISDEARAKRNATHQQTLGETRDVLTLWSPVVNMARDPRWGRTQETYGEDPWLTGRLGVAFVRGLQGDDAHYLKVVATPKHFAGNNVEEGRGGKNIVADERYLQEYEFAGFRACIMEARAESIMAAYTAINGVPSSANKWLLTDVLRGMWGFQGYAVSDCGAVSNTVDQHHYARTPEEAAADCLNAGLDMEGGWFAKYPDVVNHYLQRAIDQGLIKPEVVDHAVSLVLTSRFRLGMYDPPERVPYTRIPESVIRSPEHIALARQLGDESLVLLKNETAGAAPLLPIDPAHVRKIVVVDPNADSAQIGDYSGTPTNPISPLQGLRERAEKAGLTLTAIPWAAAKSVVIPADALSTSDGRSGLSAEYFSSGDLSGPPAGVRLDPQVNFDWSHTAPDAWTDKKEFSARWSGFFTAPGAGNYTFSLLGDGGYRLFVDGRRLIDFWNVDSSHRLPQSATTGRLEPGRHSIRLEYHHDGGDTGLALSWTTPQGDNSPAPVRGADLVVAVMGITDDDESEGHDRSSIRLPAEQEEFVQKIMALNPRTVVVLESGSALAAPWVASHVPAIVQAWYPGQEGGHAVADILFGDVNPSGRLPLTFYADDAQLRPIDEYDITKGRTYMYLKGRPLYAFGHGLSFTTFKYTNLRLSGSSASANDHVSAGVEVTNTGTRDGDEVVQGYVHARRSSVPMPLRQLWAFQRVSIPAGQTRTVTLRFDTKNFGHWDKGRQRFVVEPGRFDLMVGAASDDIRLSQPLVITP